MDGPLRLVNQLRNQLNRLARAKTETENLFVVAEQNRGWVLEGICQDLAARLRDSAIWYENERRALPRARSYFFSHASLFLARARQLRDGTRVAVLFTHPSRPVSEGDRVLFNRVRPQVLCMSAEGMAFLEEGGVDPTLLSRGIPGVDEQLFQPHQRSSGVIGFSSAYYERKNPSTMLEIVRSMPDERFMLIGRGWDSSPFAEELASLSNLQHVDAAYAEYPSLYEKMDVFVSVSVLEGGPMPLLEAMMSNVVPVATRTGFAPDLIDHGANGLLADTTSPASHFVDLIKSARRITTDVRATVERYTLDAYAALVDQALHHIR